MSRERPELLGAEGMRNYLLALSRRDRWLPLGRVLYPTGLGKCHVRTPCDLYAVPLAGDAVDPDDVPSEVTSLNERYFCTACAGLTEQQAAWEIVSFVGMRYPSLWRFSYKDFYELNLNRRVAGKKDRKSVV